MQQDDQRPIAGLDVMQSLVADLGVPLTKLAAIESWHMLFRHPTRAVVRSSLVLIAAPQRVVSALA